MDEKNKQQAKDIFKFFKIVGIIIALVFAVGLWYVSIPAVVIWYLYKKDKRFSPKTKKIVSISVTAVFLILGSVTLYSNRTPVVQILSPENNTSIQAERILIEGSVSPKKSTIKISDIPVVVDENGQFSYNLRLRAETNLVNIEATNNNNKKVETISVVRILTEEEKRIQEEANIKAQKEKEAQLAKEKAEQEAYNNSPAGRLCKKHPTWSREECDALIERKVWIGMSYDMLLYLRGKPNSVNPSNYGSGIKYQYCWNDYTPSCFYDNNNDDIVDSYN